MNEEFDPFQDNREGLDHLNIERSGKHTECENLVREHIGWMLSVAKRVIGDSHLAEDVVQNAFEKIFRNLETFEGRSSIKTWMHRVVVNEALMLLRKNRRTGDSNIEDLMPQFDASRCRIEDQWITMETPQALAEKAQTKAIVEDRIGILPDNYRVVLVLRDIEEFSTAEVAELLELSESAVKVRLHRARAALKKLLEPLMRGIEL